MSDIPDPTPTRPWGGGAAPAGLPLSAPVLPPSLPQQRTLRLLFPPRGEQNVPEERHKGGGVLVFLTSRAQDSRGLPGTAKGPS